MTRQEEQLRQQERDRLRTIAKGWLTLPESAPRFERFGGVQRILRLWRYPSLRGPWEALVLYRASMRYRSSMLELPAYELTWDRKTDPVYSGSLDPEATPRPDPTIAIRRWGVPAELVERRFAELQTLVFPPFSSSGYGTDGVDFGVEAKLGFGTTTIHWWSRVPAGMEPLARWYRETWDESRAAQQVNQPAAPPVDKPEE